ncbi:alpha/beta hydrolase [Mucilaginibacter gotjawali]|uniref:Acetyl esterase/lipase n=2 Tax=Mucilaginibacter gotjawali TaxID=1550579 RepID=A0A839SHS6_9SPHI|nr:alpha/beta hydrolase [Mucilaginibacter gotjawali]MBB3057815.1 acetyl esterase/lipase [Mucilaginibacter gotjawali]BAU52616.1 Acetylxylan esterase precursor [Mucilaginibacter gotjawali]
MRNYLKLILCTFILPAALHAQDHPAVIPLWPNGAPGFEQLRNEPEQAKDYWVRHITNPTLTVFLPAKDKANGAAVVVCPGGGHRLLVWTAEGIDPAKYLSNLGFTVFVLKYRLGRDTLSPFKIEVHARQDGLRAMRLVRSHAAEYSIDPNRVGIMGFSAGGEVVDMVTFGPNGPDANAPDPVDRLTAKPNFVIQIYPGPLFIPDTVPQDTPTTFLLAANDDPCCSVSLMRLLDAYRAAKVPVEAHLYTQGAHGFNMGYRSKLRSISSWPARLTDWLYDNNIIEPVKGDRPKVEH